MKTLKKLRRAYDEIQPVGSEDPERDAALAAHESGETEAQDRRKAKDVSSRSDPWLAMVKRQYNDKIYTSVRNTFKASGKEAAANYLQKFTTRKVEGATAQPPTRGEDVLPVPIKTSNAVPMPTENDGAQRYATDRWRGKDKMPPMRAKDTDPRKPLYVQGEWKVMPTHDPDKVQVLRGTQLVNEVEDLEAAKRFIAGKAKTADAELKNTSTQDIKMEILALEDKEKLSNVQAARLKMLKDELSNRRGTDHVRPVGDANAASDPHLAEVKKTWNDKIYKKYLSIYNMDGKEAATKYLQQFTTKKLGDHKRATDAKIVEQRGGSEPADHLYRASVYEVQGDRARALDSYRAAASGFRRLASDATEQYIVTGETTSNGSKQSFFNSKVEADKESEKLKQLGWKNVKVSSANDAARKREAQARDGINACQTKFAQQYQHPGTGRVKVCDSASTALRTAVERTRAGEVVSVIGKTVRPGRARVCDSREGVWMCSECKTGHTSETELHKHQEKTGHWRTPTGNPLTKEEAGHSQWQAKDGAFAKLEGKLEKEGESKRKASGTDLVNAHTWSVSDLNSTLAELQRALKDARTPGKPQYGGNTRQIEEDIADAKRALASKSSAKDGAFAKLEGKLEKEGESKQEAGGVAYEAGAAKYGKAGMAAKSAAARDDDTEELAQRIKSLVKELKADGTTNMSTRNLKQLVNTRGLRFTNQNHFERAFSEALAKAGVAKFVAMAEEAGRTKAKDSREVQPV
jgi:hypothetical protein